MVTGQLADMPTHRLPTRGLDISRLVNSRTGQLAVSQMPPKERKLRTQSRRWHPRVVQSASCPVRELSSLRVDQSARCPVRESYSPRVGVSTSCPVTAVVTVMACYVCRFRWQHPRCQCPSCRHRCTWCWPGDVLQLVYHRWRLQLQPTVTRTWYENTTHLVYFLYMVWKYHASRVLSVPRTVIIHY